jgi:hypothetical protein
VIVLSAPDKTQEFVVLLVDRYAAESARDVRLYKIALAMFLYCLGDQADCGVEAFVLSGVQRRIDIVIYGTAVGKAQVVDQTELASL